MRSLPIVHSASVDGQQGPVSDGAAASTVLQCYLPPPPLSSFVTSFWINRSAARTSARERVLPTGTAQLVIDLSGDGLFVPDPAHAGDARPFSHALLHGPYTYPFLAGTDRPTWKLGANFAPGGAYPFFAPPASDLQNAHLPLEALWGRHAVQELGERLAETHTSQERFHVLEQALLAHLLRPLDRHPAVWRALHAFSGAFAPPRQAIQHTARIADVAGAVGLSATRLGSLFREEIGLTPKQYVRIQRFQHVLQRTRRCQRVNWGRLAVECGYYDQAHLIKEFRALAGARPSDYLRDRNEQMPTYFMLAT